MAVVWTAIDKATLEEFQRGASDLTLRNRWFLRRLRAKKRITFNHSGTNPNWAVEVGQHSVTARTRGQERDFQSHDPWERLSTTWGHFEATDMIAREDELVNRGDPALIKHVQTIASRLSKSMRTRFCGQLYQDGNAAANEGLLHGLKTMVSAGSWTAATDVLVKPGTGTYGGKNVALGSYGGTWTSDLGTSPNATLAVDYPDGQGDPAYDFNACKLVPVNSENWDTDGQTDAASNLIPAIRRSKIWCRHTSDPDDAPDMLTLGSKYFFEFKQALDPRLEVRVPVGSEDLGMPELLNFEGLEITEEYDCPSEYGWMQNLSKMEIQSMNSDLFDVTAPWIDQDNRSKKFAINFDGQVVYQPKFFALLYEATAA